jgi:hypothetical protein
MPLKISEFYFRRRRNPQRRPTELLRSLSLECLECRRLLTAAPYVHEASLLPSDGQYFGNFGDSVAISGNTVVVGAPDATVNGNQSEGEAYVFVEQGGNWGDMTETAILTPSDGRASAYFVCVAA